MKITVTEEFIDLTTAGYTSEEISEILHMPVAEVKALRRWYRQKMHVERDLWLAEHGWDWRWKGAKKT